MRKLLILVVCAIWLLFNISAIAWTPLVIGGSGSAGDSCAGDWCDDFDGGSGTFSNRSGWATEYATNGNQYDYMQLTNDEIQRTSNGGSRTYILDEQTPTDKNYSVQLDVKLASDSSTDRSGGPIIRASSTAVTNTLNGYIFRIRPSDNRCQVQRLINDSHSGYVIDTYCTDLDWTSYHTVKLTVSGGSSDCSTGENVTITLDIDGSQEAQADDATASCINDTNSGGVQGYWSAGQGDQFYDDYVFTD